MRLHSLNQQSASSQLSDKQLAIHEQLQRQVDAVQATTVDTAEQVIVPAEETAMAQAEAARLEALTPDSWPALYGQLGISGILHSIASHLALTGRNDNTLLFTLDQAFSSLYDDAHQRRLADSLSDFFQHPCRVQIQVGEVCGGTPARLAATTWEAHIIAASEVLDGDPLVCALKAELGAQLLPESVQYLD